MQLQILKKHQLLLALAFIVAFLGSFINAEVILSDDFSSGTLTGWTSVDEGATSGPSIWGVTNLSGNMVAIQSSNIYSNHGSDIHIGSYLKRLSSSVQNYSVSLDVMSSDDDYNGIMFGYQNSSNYYRFSISNQFANRTLQKMVGGTFTTLASDAVAFTLNQWYNIKVTVIDSYIKVYVDNSLLFNVMDSTFSTLGSIGLYVSASQNGYFDNVLVQSVPEASSIALLLFGLAIFALHYKK
ncbi:MAG: DUF1080 domain-containing protein [Candidatus Brocadiae bacterium]|nr:DUF1080 domain-containing protein [Candidatus Brocadiia bacterium]